MRYFYTVIIKVLILTFIGFALVPLNIRLSKKLHLEDVPNKRRINKVPTPSSGGITVYIVFLLGLLWFVDILANRVIIGLGLGGLIIVITGVVDDRYELKPYIKLFGMSLGILTGILISGLVIDSVSIPYVDYKINLGYLAPVITFIWVLALTNATNLIDGLDGLAGGTSIISASTMGIIAYFYLPQPTNLYVSVQCFLLVASIAGFMPYNFHPAKIYLGDTGALFIGFILGMLSIQGLKNATVISVITPMVIMGVPITDTIYAIIRRKLNKKPISEADAGHLHHRLLKLGFSQTGTVWLIYGISILFSFIALLFKYNNVWANALLWVSTLIGIEIFVEAIGLLGEDRTPILSSIKWLLIKMHLKHTDKANAERAKALQKAKDLEATKFKNQV